MSCPNTLLAPAPLSAGLPGSLHHFVCRLSEVRGEEGKSGRGVRRQVKGRRMEKEMRRRWTGVLREAAGQRQTEPRARKKDGKRTEMNGRRRNM